MKLLLSYVRKHKKILFLALFLATVNQVFSLLDVQVFRILVDEYASKALTLEKSVFFTGVIKMLLLSVLLAFISRVAKNFQDYYVSIITQRVGANLYSHSIDHSFSLPYSAFEDQRSGELLLKLQKARTDSQGLITSFIGVIFLTSVSLVFVIGYAFWVNWTIGLVYITLLPLVGSVQYYLSKKIKDAQKQIITETASLAGSTTETLRNVELVKSLGLEDQESKRLNSVNDRILQLELKKIKLIRYLSFIQGTFMSTIRSAMMFLFMYLIFTKVLSFGEFFGLWIYQFFIFEPLNMLGMIANQYQETQASMEKLQVILDTKPEEKPKNPVVLEKIDSINFENVSFSYAGVENDSTKDLNLSLKKGETTAFVGPSGAGKTTIIKLILGLYKPTKGKILINGIDSQTVDYDVLRQRVGYVSQDTQLFAGTIRENLLFVRPDATDAECLLALKHASATSIVEGKGLDTKIGEGGIKISGGEKQRLAIARALLRNPSIIIFDEATSSLDSMTEKEITKTIKDISKEMPDLITIMIAHRLSTIMHSDKIFVLEKGYLSEEGGHEELLSKKGLYFALWREQDASISNLTS